MNTVQKLSMDILSTNVMQRTMATTMSVVMSVTMTMVWTSHVNMDWTNIDVSTTIVMVMTMAMMMTTLCDKIERVNNVIMMMTMWVTIMAKRTMMLSVSGHEAYLSDNRMIIES